MIIKVNQYFILYLSSLKRIQKRVKITINGIKKRYFLNKILKRNTLVFDIKKIR